MWVNVIAIAGLFLQSQFGFVFAGEEQAALLVVVNLILRAITKEEVGLHDE
jgi:hypothetical protein